MSSHVSYVQYILCYVSLLSYNVMCHCYLTISCVTVILQCHCYLTISCVTVILQCHVSLLSYNVMCHCYLTMLCVTAILQMSLTHHSYQFQATCNEDHMITTASNCAPRHIFTVSPDHHQQSWRRGYIGVMQALCDVDTHSTNPYK